MTVHVLVTGSLFRTPEQRHSQAGKRYVAATIKTAGTDSAEFWSALCFSDTAGAELLRLGVNERLTVQGTLKIELFEKDGQARISRTVFVDSVLALRAPPREKKPKPEPPPAGGRPPLERVNILPAIDDDEIPF